MQRRTNPALTVYGHATLDEFDDVAAALDARWGEVDAFCEEIPATLVHGDFVGNNIRARPGDDGSLSDWCLTGRSRGSGAHLPAGMLDKRGYYDGRRAYMATVAEMGSVLKTVDIKRMACVGGIFRAVVALKRACWSMGLMDQAIPLGNISLFAAGLRALPSQLVLTAGAHE
jgi:hypothetical protein